MSASATGLNVMEVIKSFLVGFKARFTKKNSCLVPLTGPKTSGWLGHRPRGESNTNNPGK